MSKIEAKNLSYKYKISDKIFYQALNDISFRIEDGDFVAFVGETGAGKSTLMQIFNGLLLPESGTLKIEDFLITNNKRKNKKQIIKLRKKVGMVFQFPEYQLFEKTVLDDVMFGPLNFGFKKEDARESSIKALKAVGLDESFLNRSPFDLSGGEKRRVAIAGILSYNPDILILDEITVGLDPKSKDDIMDLIVNLNKLNKTIILVTHDMEVVMKYCKKVFVLNNGKLIKETTPIYLFNDENITDYSLEIPPLFQFKNLLKKYNYKYNIDKYNDINSLINKIIKEIK
ncbi:MAG: energy-coupling factor transporter ATPase [Bacillales bacterium]